MSRRAQGVLVLVALVLLAAAPASAAPAPVATVVVDGVISPVTLRLVESALTRAKAGGAQALVIQLDTPGGLERSMRAICQRLLNAEIPVVVWVGPTGARAASAGVFITMAAHVAAMAPATNIGAAHPVSVGGGMDKESMRKVENDAAAFIRTIAIERGRNAEWGEKAVRQSVSVTEREAVRLKVVDFIADSIPDLLTKLDGRTVKTSQGPVTLATREAVAKPIEIGFRVSWRVIVPTVALTAAFFLFALTLGVRALRRRPLLGVSGLVGQTGVARGALEPEGQVSVHGEIWRAVADRPLADGTPVTVVDVQGLTLRVVGSDASGGGTR